MKETWHRFRSTQLGNERSIWILEPGEPASHALIFLDGEFYREKLGAAALIHELEGCGEIGPTLAVFVSMESPSARWLECPCNPRFARFIDEELCPWLEELHPEYRSAQERGIVGLSYSGLAAAYVALSAPRRFTRLVAQSGSFWWNDCWLVRHVERLRPPPDLHVYLSVGERETQTGLNHREGVFQTMSQIEGVERFRDALRWKGLETVFRRFDGGHGFASWASDLPGALKWALPLPSRVV